MSRVHDNQTVAELDIPILLFTEWDEHYVFDTIFTYNLYFYNEDELFATELGVPGKRAESLISEYRRALGSSLIVTFLKVCEISPIAKVEADGKDLKVIDGDLNEQESLEVESWALRILEDSPKCSTISFEVVRDATGYLKLATLVYGGDNVECKQSDLSE